MLRLLGFLSLLAVMHGLKLQGKDDDFSALKAMGPYEPTGPDALVSLAWYEHGMSNNIWKFVKSARMAGYPGRIILGVHPNFLNNQQDQAIASALGVTAKVVNEAPCVLPYNNTATGYMLREKCAADFPHLKLESARFSLAGKWLKECSECTGWAMVHDADDLILQNHPFEGMGSPKGDELILVEELYLNGSPRGLNTGHWFVHPGVQGCYNFDLGKHPMLCSGTILGAKDQMVKFMERMTDEFENNVKKGTQCDPSSIADQAVLNYLYYSGSLTQLNAKTSAYGRGPVATLGAVCSDETTTGKDHSATDLLKLDDAGYVLNDNGAKFNIVHQDKTCWDNLMLKYLHPRYMQKSVADVMTIFHAKVEQKVENH